jgi:hypothetical protein
VLLGRQLHFFGGLDAPADAGNDRPDHWVLNLDGGTGWTSAAPLPNPRDHIGYAGFKGKAYAIGGEKAQNGPFALAEVDAYDPATDTWARLSDMPVPTAHTNNATFVLNGRIVMVGGSAADGALYNNVLAYDPSTDSWGALPSLPTPLSGTTAQQINGEIIAAGGSTSPSIIDTTLRAASDRGGKRRRSPCRRYARCSPGCCATRRRARGGSRRRSRACCGGRRRRGSTSGTPR